MAQYDVVLFGATGFTGSLILEYLLQKGGVSFAICGRSREKLEEKIAEATTRHNLPLDATTKPDIFVLDVLKASQQEIQDVVKKARCVCTAVGPFVKYGEPLVQACAELGVDYVDTCGESTFFRNMIEKYDAVAKKNGSRIVVHCGNDCVPWDLMVWKLWKLLGKDLKGVKILCEMKCAGSGGTISTAVLNMQTKPPRSTCGFDPLYLVDGKKSECDTKINLPKGAKFYEEAGQKGGPWIMGPVMANAVRRTNAILNMVPDLQYEEAMLESSDAGDGAMMKIAVGTSVYLPFLKGFWEAIGVIPAAGAGPTREQMDEGFLTLTGYASNAEGKTTTTAVMKFNTDAGYKDTARMCAEAAFSLVALPKLLQAGGVYSPAAACAEGLLERLLATGTTLEVTTL